MYQKKEEHMDHERALMFGMDNQKVFRRMNQSIESINHMKKLMMCWIIGKIN